MYAGYRSSNPSLGNLPVTQKNFSTIVKFNATQILKLPSFLLTPIFLSRT